MCTCYDCGRRVGITDSSRRDCLGEYRYPPDGRFIAKVTDSGLSAGRLVELKDKVYSK
jgi:hypothetical protein